MLARVLAEVNIFGWQMRLSWREDLSQERSRAKWLQDRRKERGFLVWSRSGWVIRRSCRESGFDKCSIREGDRIGKLKGRGSSVWSVGTALRMLRSLMSSES